MIPVIGLDVGGANTRGGRRRRARVRLVSEPFEVWRDLRAWLT
jgi:hypothetical protein